MTNEKKAKRRMRYNTARLTTKHGGMFINVKGTDVTVEATRYLRKLFFKYVDRGTVLGSLIGDSQARMWQISRTTSKHIYFDYHFRYRNAAVGVRVRVRDLHKLFGLLRE